jgi:hypothetical protein
LSDEHFRAPNSGNAHRNGYFWSDYYLTGRPCYHYRHD